MESEEITRFEKARLIGSRALQISMGAEPKVEYTADIDPIEIAIKELEEGKMPLKAMVNKEKWQEL
ncbi:MAG: DNA-directed RNA polymerase subunit K [Methanobacteriaceae archaeon]|nr:DNA-directed RNA polymerase subunit K [Methanobacteriaceae archaeon]